MESPAAEKYRPRIRIESQRRSDVGYLMVAARIDQESYEYAKGVS
jgi:hypothetical protein